MAVESDISHELLLRLKEELEKVLDDYKKIVSLRIKKIEQDQEQIAVYFDILGNKLEGIKLSDQQQKKIDKFLSRKEKTGLRPKTYRKQQDQLEDRFLEIQNLLVGMISKRFKY